MNNYTVYEHLFPNGKRYIGITKLTPKERWEKNGNGYKTQSVFRAITKYGWDNIEHNIISTNLSYEDACNMEVELIKKYKTMNKKYGYNNTSGGDAKYIVSKSTIERMCKAQKGHKCSEKTKQVNREKRLGKPRPIAEVIKTAKALRGRKIGMTEYRLERIKEGIANMSIDKKKQWRDNVNKGLVGKRAKHHIGKKIVKRHLFTGEILNIYNSIAQAAKENAIDSSSIIRVCKLKQNRNSACGFIWQYYDEKTIENKDFEIDIVNQENIDYSPLLTMVEKRYKDFEEFAKINRLSNHILKKINQGIGLSYKIMNKFSNIFDCRINDLYQLRIEKD